jgi:hypothetical protein
VAVDDAAGRAVPARATIYGGVLGELDQIDQAVYRAIAATPSPSLDFLLSRLSSAADHSKLWFAVAGALALTPGRPGEPPCSGPIDELSISQTDFLDRMQGRR